MRRVRRGGWMVSRRPVPDVRLTIGFPPPTAILLFPNPLTANIRPAAAIHVCGRKHKGVFLALIREALTDNNARVVNRFCDRQDLEVAVSKVAQRVQVIDVAAHVEKRMLSIILQSRRPNDDPSHVRHLTAAAAGYARRAPSVPRSVMPYANCASARVKAKSMKNNAAKLMLFLVFIVEKPPVPALNSRPPTRKIWRWSGSLCARDIE